MSNKIWARTSPIWERGASSDLFVALLFLHKYAQLGEARAQIWLRANYLNWWSEYSHIFSLIIWSLTLCTISVYNIQCILYYNETEGKELTKLRENVVLLDFPSGTKEWAEKWYEAFTHVRLIFHLFW